MAKLPAERYLSPSERMSEVIFGIIMAMTVTSSLRIALGTSSDALMTMVVTTLGNNLAWGIVDAVVYLLLVLFERHRMHEVFLRIKSAPTIGKAAKIVREDLKRTLVHVLPRKERDHICSDIVYHLSGTNPKRQGLKGKDFLGALWSLVLVFTVAVPIVLPYLFLPDVRLAIYLSDIIAIVLLFLVGYVWARYTNWNKVLAGLVFVVIGVVIAVVTVALGG